MLTRLTFFFAAFLGIFLAALPHIIWLIGWIAGKIFHFPLHYAPFGWTALGLAVFVWMLMAYGYFVGRFRIDTTAAIVTSPLLPQSFKGYKIVHISDFHLSTFSDRPSHVQKLIDSINDIKPDLICFTGDLVTMSASEARPYSACLRQLHAKDGVMSILGNHDFFIYNNSIADMQARDKAVADLADLQRGELGWMLLRNEHHVIHRGNDSICIIGVDNIHGGGQGFSTVDYGDLRKAAEGTGGYRILLTHDPSHWESEVLCHTNIPLTLSGHTHSAQVRLFGWNPASLVFHQSWGKYEQDGQTIYVNAGLGCTLPIRINCPSEITVITLQ